MPDEYCREKLGGSYAGRVVAWLVTVTERCNVREPESYESRSEAELPIDTCSNGIGCEGRGRGACACACDDDAIAELPVPMSGLKYCVAGLGLAVSTPAEPSAKLISFDCIIALSPAASRVLLLIFCSARLALADCGPNPNIYRSISTLALCLPCCNLRWPRLNF